MKISEIKLRKFDDVQEGDTVMYNPFIDWEGERDFYAKPEGVIMTSLYMDRDMLFEGERTVHISRPDEGRIHVSENGYWYPRAMLLVKGVDYT